MTKPHTPSSFDVGERIPPPPHRHAAPSAPWPWLDIHHSKSFIKKHICISELTRPSEVGVDPNQLETDAPPVPTPCKHDPDNCNNCWKEYPQSLFPNWTEVQVKNSKIYNAIHDAHSGRCEIRTVDVDRDGAFVNPHEALTNEEETDEEKTWEFVVNSNPSKDVRVRAMFVGNMSGPVLQMLGAKYVIEPFFFSSALGWIPSRFQAQHDSDGDHVTIIMTYLRKAPDGDASRLGSRAQTFLRKAPDEDASRLGSRAQTPVSTSSAAISNNAEANCSQEQLVNETIDTQAALKLLGGHMLVLDLISLHAVRRRHGSTIISYHHNKNLPTTSAKELHERIQLAGQSVYWQKIFQRSPDPTFVLLVYIWHALYAWDEALEHLYAHICQLETRVITTAEMDLTRELHVIRAHHLHYASLLEDFKKTVNFIRDTHYPHLHEMTEAEQAWNISTMERETSTILDEIARLEKGTKMQDRRLKNVMNLVFSTVNINDSKRMQQMTEAAARDSAAMKQIAYLTMVFLPASFVATAFGMNIQEINPGTKETLEHYFETAIPLTLATIWIIVAFQCKYMFNETLTNSSATGAAAEDPSSDSKGDSDQYQYGHGDSSPSRVPPFWKRMGWPIFLPLRKFGYGPWKIIDYTKRDSMMHPPDRKTDGVPIITRAGAMIQKALAIGGGSSGPGITIDIQSPTSVTGPRVTGHAPTAGGHSFLPQ